MFVFAFIILVELPLLVTCSVQKENNFKAVLMYW